MTFEKLWQANRLLYETSEKETHIGGKETYIGGKETYIGEKETYMGGKEAHIGGSASALALAHTFGAYAERERKSLFRKKEKVSLGKKMFLLAPIQRERDCRKCYLHQSNHNFSVENVADSMRMSGSADVRGSIYSSVGMVGAKLTKDFPPFGTFKGFIKSVREVKNFSLYEYILPFTYKI